MSDRNISPTAWVAPATARLTVSLTYTRTDGSTQTIVPESLLNSYSVQAKDTKTLATGNNAITVPTNAQGCLIVLPVGNTYDINIKGATSGDAGFIQNVVGWAVVTFKKDTPPATLNVNNGGGGSLAGVEFFWY